MKAIANNNVAILALSFFICLSFFPLNADGRAPKQSLGLLAVKNAANMCAQTNDWVSKNTLNKAYEPCRGIYRFATDTIRRVEGYVLKDQYKEALYEMGNVVLDLQGCGQNADMPFPENDKLMKSCKDAINVLKYIGRRS